MSPFILAVYLLGQIVGAETIYSVQEGDSLTSIGARFGIDVRVLIRENQLQESAKLKPGQSLSIDNRHIVPPPDGSKILINVPQRMLFHFLDDGVARGYPIAAGKLGWRTPLGEFEITTLEKDPTWDVPVSIQEEMRRSGKPVLTRVPPSPSNPLGEYWIGLTLPAIGIHGTNAPSSIYKLATHGCIRLHPQDILDLFNNIYVGMRGRINYETVLILRERDSIFLEVHTDSYRKQSDPLRKVLDLARSEGFLELLDLARVQEVIANRDGVARDVTRQ